MAELAGVSPKTVSNVVHGHPYVSVETRERVLQAMTQLDYRANLSARNLARGRSGVVALAVPRLGNPFFAELAGKVIEAAERRSCTVLIDETRGEAGRERRIIEGLTPLSLDGVIISVQGLGKADLESLNPNGALVLLGERIFDGPADHVAADNIAAAKALTKHLIGIGRRRIAAIGLSGTPLRGTPDLRLEGYRRALRGGHIKFQAEYVVPVHAYGREDGAAAMAQLLALKPRPDAVICFNDEMAIGALNALARAGVSVPEEIAVAGFDDIVEGRYSYPTLTSVSWDNEKVAEVALDLLEERIGNGDGVPPREVQTGFELMVRQSTSST
ncbi:MAG TPA: LacI family DNA-binding transcriptional regulator [Nocardioidaceae bacterium]